LWRFKNIAVCTAGRSVDDTRMGQPTMEMSLNCWRYGLHPPANTQNKHFSCFANLFGTIATRISLISVSIFHVQGGLECSSVDTRSSGTGHDHDANFDPLECPTCSLRLATKEGTCPRCVQKSQIIRRVNELIRPYRRGTILLCLLTVAGVSAEWIPPKLQFGYLNLNVETDMGPDRFTMR